MPHVLIPDGFTLKKVTKLQKEAVDAKRRHEDVLALLTNPNTPLVVGTAVATFFGVKYTENLVEELVKEVGELTEETERKVRGAVDAANPLNVDLTQFIDTSSAPVKADFTVGDFVKELQKRFPF